jgi:hypothetical protein
VAAAQAATPHRPSIVNGQIAAALNGESGDTAFTRRISGPTIFVNPLMAIYFTVDLTALATRCLYLDQLEDTGTVRQIEAQIEQFRWRSPAHRKDLSPPNGGPGRTQQPAVHQAALDLALAAA